MANAPLGIDALSGGSSNPAPAVTADSLAPLSGPPSGGTGASSSQAPPAQKAGFLNSMLKAISYGLVGAAAGGAAKTPGAGAAAGVEAGVGLAQRSFENRQTEQTNQARIKFESVQAAESVARAHLLDAQLHALPQEQQDAHNKANADILATYTGIFGTPQIAADNHGTGAMAALTQLNQAHGAVPSIVTLNTGDKIYAWPADNQNGIQLVNQVRQIQGMPDITASQWAQLSRDTRSKMTVDASQFYATPAPTKESAGSLLQQSQQWRDAYKMRPNADPQVSKFLDDRVGFLQGAQKAFDVHDQKVKTDEANAMVPIEAEKARRVALAQQAINQGKPEDAGTLLANGDLTLSELKSRGTTPAFITAATNAAKKIDANYNPQAAEAAFNVAKSPENVKFFGSAKSLTDKGGTLDQLAAAAKDIPDGQIPVFNKISDAAQAAAGSGPIAKYASILLGVSDDYSKVMGGGQGSDASREQALKLVPAHASPEARAAAIEGIRGAVGSQIESRIGNNKVMQRMYGTPKSQSAAPSNDPFAKFGGKSR